jgi:two-component system sensor histidine kinase BaeS
MGGMASSLMLRDEQGIIPLVITDHKGNILQGQFRGSDGNLQSSVPVKQILNGAPYYEKGEVAGYVLTGTQAGMAGEDGEMIYIQSIFRGILLYPTIAALFASIFGAILLRKVLNPLKSLYKGVVSIGKGEYSYRVVLPPHKFFFNSEDELTLLSRGFNDMASSIEASENWKKQIISDTAHELRTPVSLIMGNLEMILDGVYEADRSRLESLYRESTNLAELIRNLQVLASEESRQNRTEKEAFSLTRLVVQSAEDFKALGDKKEISLCQETGEDELIFKGDRNKTRQVVKNLLVNALRHTPSGGKIIIRSYKQEKFYILEVEDTGPGIPEALRARVFDRFFKIDQARNSDGSGLGLSISKALIENQGGTISVHEGTSGGALFRISFTGEPRSV